MLPPRLPVVGPEDDDLALLAPEAGKVGHLDDDRPEELGPGRAELQDAGGDGLALHEGRRVDQLVLLEVSARHAHRHGRLARRYDDPDARVAAAAHGAAPRVDHEADEEPDRGEGKEGVSCRRKTGKRIAGWADYRLWPRRHFLSRLRH